jgi:hypothetical protein
MWAVDPARTVLARALRRLLSALLLVEEADREIDRC